MNFLKYPVISKPLFLQYGTTKQNVKTFAAKGKIKHINKIRNNTRNVLDEKYKMFVEQSAQNASISKDVFEDFLYMLIFLDFPKTKSKQERMKSREFARERKSVLQNFQDVQDENELNSKEENLSELVKDLEKSDKAKADEKSRALFELYLWAMKREAIRRYNEKKKQNKRKSKLRKRAKRYLKSIKAKNNNFAEKVNKSKQPELLREAKIQKSLKKYCNSVAVAEEMADLQDLYESSNNNMRMIINVANQILK